MNKNYIYEHRSSWFIVGKGQVIEHVIILGHNHTVGAEVTLAVNIENGYKKLAYPGSLKKTNIRVPRILKFLYHYEEA